MANALLQERSVALQNSLAYFRYEGPLVENGYLDARKAGETLLGIDEVVRYFLVKEEKRIAELEFEIPVRVQKGSWEALIPHDFGQWLMTALGLGATKYVATAVTEMAKNDFKDKGIKDIVKEAFKGLKWVITIAKHLGSMRLTGFFNGAPKQVESGDVLIEIRNDAGELLPVPEKFLRWYRDCPPQLFERLTKHIQLGRELGIGTKEKLDEEDIAPEVKIKVGEKYIFTKPEEEEEVLFPELTHGLPVELYGRVTKGNEKENTLGFEYNQHILMCTPMEGKITQYKPAMFSNCFIKGVIDRKMSDGSFNARRPSIRFSSIVNLDGAAQQSLFA